MENILFKNEKIAILDYLSETMNRLRFRSEDSIYSIGSEIELDFGDGKKEAVHIIGLNMDQRTYIDFHVMDLKQSLYVQNDKQYSFKVIGDNVELSLTFKKDEEEDYVSKRINLFDFVLYGTGEVDFNSIKNTEQNLYNEIKESFAELLMDSIEKLVFHDDDFGEYMDNDTLSVKVKDRKKTKEALLKVFSIRYASPK